MTAAILCGPPKGCTCPAVAWVCCCAASEHGRRMIAGLPCDCGFCSALGPQRDHGGEGAETGLERQHRVAKARLSRLPEAYR